MLGQVASRRSVRLWTHGHVMGRHMVFAFLCALAVRPTAAAAEMILVAFGDSFTAGLGLPPEAAFPARLQTWLSSRNIPVRVLNEGVSGETTEMALRRVDRVIAQRPAMVIIELGANDALRGIQPAVAKRNLETMIARIRLVTPNLLLTGMRAPTNWGDEYREAFDQIYPEIAAANRVPLYPFFLDGVAENRALNQRDGLHPNELGVQSIVDHIGPVVQLLLRAPGP